MNKKIAIIGMGHMGKAVYEGLLFCGVKKENIFVSNKLMNNKKVAILADWILLAVKPDVISEVIIEIKDVIADKIVFSVAAGITASHIEKYAQNKKQKIIRLMPNLPIAYGQGVIGFYANKSVSLVEKKDSINLFSGLGVVIDCKKEKDIDVITIIAGSGSGIVAYFISLLEKSARSFGLEKGQAEKVVLQTFVGTLALMQKNQQSAQDLQRAVATKGGVTEQIITGLEKEKIFSRFTNSLQIGYGKIKKIEEELKK